MARQDVGQHEGHALSRGFDVMFVGASVAVRGYDVDRRRRATVLSACFQPESGVATSRAKKTQARPPLAPRSEPYRAGYIYGS